LLASDVLRYHISKGGVGEVVEGKGFRHTVKAKTVVLYGKLECNVRGLVYELGWRDSMLHSSAIPHKVRNVGKEKAIYLTVCSPPGGVMGSEPLSYFQLQESGCGLVERFKGFKPSDVCDLETLDR
jgi:hypothetical protein